MFKQLRLSFQMTVAAFKMTMAYPASLLVALGNLAFLTLVAVAPLTYMFWLFGEDTTAGYAFLKYFYQFWIVDNTLPYTASGDIAWTQVDFGTTASAFFLWALVLYFLWATIVAFGALLTATVIMHTGIQQLRGQKPSLADGFRLAGHNIGRLAGLAVIAGFLMTLVKRTLVVMRVVPFVGRWVQRAVMAAITATLYVVLPIVVYERNGPWNAFRNTWTNIRKTWGGLVVGTGTILTALWIGLWIVQVAFLTALGDGVGETLVGWDTVMIIQVISAVLLYCLNVALSANLRAALYLHVVEGHTGVIPDAAFERAPTTPPAAANKQTTFELRPGN